MSKILEKVRLESNEDWSNLGDILIRVVNGLGSIGFGFTIGAVAMSWIPLPLIWQQMMGAVLVLIIFDGMLIVWESRAELQNGSTRQNKISKNAVTMSLWASTVASVAFLILQILPFIFQSPADGQFLADLSFNVRLILSLATGGVMAFQFVQNSNWLREKPQRQRDRNKAESYSHLEDEMTNIEGEILEKIPDVMRVETQQYIDTVVARMAKSKATQIIRSMGYGDLVDRPDGGPSNSDLLGVIKALEDKLKGLRAAPPPPPARPANGSHDGSSSGTPPRANGVPQPNGSNGAGPGKV